VKHLDKVIDSLKARQDATPADNSGLHYIKPGSQNRKKGYSRKAGRKNR
jgi:hypothetical protein